MKVKDLQAQLENMDPDSTVIISSNGDNHEVLSVDELFLKRDEAQAEWGEEISPKSKKGYKKVCILTKH